MAPRKNKTPAIIRMRAMNTFTMDVNDIGHMEYKPIGHRFEVLREGSEEWEPIEVEVQVVEDLPKPE